MAKLVLIAPGEWVNPDHVKRVKRLEPPDGRLQVYVAGEATGFSVDEDLEAQVLAGLGAREVPAPDRGRGKRS